MYADYSYYSTAYGGTRIRAEEYNRVARLADDYIDYITAGRAQQHTDDDKVLRCACLLAEQYAVIDAAERDIAAGEAIKSESVGGHSVSYETASDTIKAAQSALYDIARRYLWPYMYRGVPCVGLR